MADANRSFGWRQWVTSTAGEDQHGRFRQLVKQVNGEADVLVLCGDLTDRGRIEEAKALAEELSALRVPCAAVLGNHDYEGGHAKDICRILREAKVHLLDGDHTIFEKRLGIAGVKGFAGGFGKATLQAFGEPAIKAFVQEAVNEALKLEAALGQLDTPKKVVIMHYAPIAADHRGREPGDPPLPRHEPPRHARRPFGAEAVFHGHAHHGTPEGKTPRASPSTTSPCRSLRRGLCSTGASGIVRPDGGKPERSARRPSPAPSDEGASNGRTRLRFMRPFISPEGVPTYRAGTRSELDLVPSTAAARRTLG